MFFKKRWLIFFLLASMNGLQAEEVKPFKHTKATNSDEYLVQLSHTKFYISSQPFIVSSNIKKDILGEDTHYDFLEKLFIKNNNLIVVTWPSHLYGMQESKITYYIYEIDNLSEVINRHEINFEDVSKIQISETPTGIKIFSEVSKKNGKKFIYEFDKGKIFDFSTSMNRSFIQKEEEKLCKGFYEFYTTYEYEYDSYQKIENIYDLGTANYSWISHKVKSSPKLSDQLINTLKGKSPYERKQLSYISFKKSFCD